MGRISIISCFIFLLRLLLFSTEIDAQHEIFTATVIEENGNKINLRWVKTEQFLANENLRIWEAEKSGLFKHNEQLAKDLGTFEAYYDLDQSSAIIYFKKFNHIFGSIGNDYDILGLPISKLNNDLVVGQSDYIQIMKKSNSVSSCSRSLSRSSSDTADPSQDIQQSSCSHCHKHPHDADKNYVKSSPEKHLRPDEDVSNQRNTHLGDFYPEILIFVNYEMIKICRNMRTAYIIILMYMNSIAMLFAKLKDHVNIHINIAAIIFEKEPGAFFSLRSMPNNLESNDKYGNLLLNSIQSYIASESHVTYTTNSQIFSQDSFDFFLLMTPDLRPSSMIKDAFRGASTEVFDIKRQRSLNNLPYILRKNLGVAVSPSDMLQNYVDVARQIAHLMRVEDDDEKSHFIMRNDKLSHHCTDNLQWSPKSVENFKRFFRQDTNRCFLMNKPRSLYEFDVPRETLSPKQQCQCYNYEITPKFSKSLIGRGKKKVCAAKLPCLITPVKKKKVSPHPITFPRPVDGTPCETDRVCWRNKCVATKINTI